MRRRITLGMTCTVASQSLTQPVMHGHIHGISGSTLLKIGFNAQSWYFLTSLDNLCSLKFWFSLDSNPHTNCLVHNHV